MSAGQRTGYVDTSRRAVGHCRRDHVVVLTAHQAVLARVGVEPGDGDARPRAAEPGQLARGERDRAGHEVAREHARHVGERDVDGREHDAQLGRIEHHRHERRSGQVREEIGVAAPREPGEREGLFADGRGRDGVDAARHRVLDGAHDNVVGGAPCRRRHEARLDGRGRGRGVHDGFADVEHPRVGGGLAGDLGSDARGIAHGQRDSRPHAVKRGPRTVAGTGPGTRPARDRGDEFA